MSKLWLLAAFAGGAVVGGVVVKLYIQGEIKAKGGNLLDQILPKEYGGRAREAWDGLVDNQFSLGGSSEGRSLQ